MSSGRPAADLKGLDVLVVEDDAAARELVTRILRDEAANVTALSGALEALAVLRDHRPDVLVSDIGMPEIDGYMFLRQVRQLEAARGYPMLPALALTAYDDTSEILRSGAAGYQRHITKPFEHTRLVQAVYELSGRQFWHKRA